MANWVRIDKVMESLQKSEEQEMYESDAQFGSIQAFTSRYEEFQKLFKIPERDLNSDEKMSFDNQKQMNQLIEQLADVWQKELVDKIDEMHRESGKVVREVQDRVEYYQRATKKVRVGSLMRLVHATQVAVRQVEAQAAAEGQPEDQGQRRHRARPRLKPVSYYILM